MSVWHGDDVNVFGLGGIDLLYTDMKDILMYTLNTWSRWSWRKHRTKLFKKVSSEFIGCRISPITSSVVRWCHCLQIAL